MQSYEATYQQVIARIRSVRDTPAKEQSLGRMRAALADLNFAFPSRGKGVILVAGTNGKGTVCKTLEVLLGPANVGLFTSPHLMSTRERIRSHGRDLSVEEFIEAFAKIQGPADRHGLSHFEILTLMMCEIFFGDRIRPAVEKAVIEVGVGGRLDPTRLIPHATSVVTKLGLDHVDLLGGTLAAIAGEKFAIAEGASLLVHAPLKDREAFEVASRACANAKVEQLEAEIYPFAIDRNGKEPRWIAQTPWGAVPLGVLGARAVENVALALTVYQRLGFDPAPALTRLENMSWPGRMEAVSFQGRRLYLSGDHNPQGVASLAEIVSAFDYEKLYLVVGIGTSKDRDQMLQAYLDFPRVQLILTSTPFRGSPVSDYGDIWRSRALAVDDDPVRALCRALEFAGERDLVIVSGSLYLVGDLRKAIFNLDCA